MSTIWQEIRFKVIHSGSRLNLLIGINVGVFLVLGIIYVLEMLTTRQSAIHDLIESYAALPSYLPKLALRFWTPVTYMFMHSGFFHLLFNMLWFFWIGQIFEEYLGGKKLLTLYFLGGLAGAVFYIAAFNIFPLFADVRQTGMVVGASAAVMAVIVGTATLLPDHTIFMMFLGAVKLKWIALFYVILAFISVVGSNAGGELAHLGGALMGFLYIKQLQKGNDMGGALGKIFTPKSKLKVAYRNIPKNEDRRPDVDQIDRILDKINKSGVKSLTRQEKEILARASNDEKS